MNLFVLQSVIPDCHRFSIQFSMYILTLLLMGGGALCAPKVFLFFSLKISPTDQTLRPTCKFIILGIFYHTFFFEKFCI